MSTLLPLDVEALDRLVALVVKEQPSLLPRVRWLMLGSYAVSDLFPQDFCVQPTIADVATLVSLLERKGLGQTASALERLTGQCRDQTEAQLDLLEAASPDSWSHPSQVFLRPWDLRQLRALCAERLTEAQGDESRQVLLQSVLAKLEKTAAREAKAARRRAGRRKRSHKPTRPRKPS